MQVHVEPFEVFTCRRQERARRFEGPPCDGHLCSHLRRVRTRPGRADALEGSRVTLCLRQERSRVGRRGRGGQGASRAQAQELDLQELHLQQQRRSDAGKIPLDAGQSVGASAQVEIEETVARHQHEVRHVVAQALPWLETGNEVLAYTLRLFVLGQADEHGVAREELAHQDEVATIPGLGEQGRHSFRRLTQAAEIAQAPEGEARRLIDLPPCVHTALTKQRLRRDTVRHRDLPFTPQIVGHTAHEAGECRYPHVFELHAQLLAFVEKSVDARSCRLAGRALEARLHGQGNGDAPQVTGLERQSEGAGLKLGAPDRVDHAEPFSDQQADVDPVPAGLAGRTLGTPIAKATPPEAQALRDERHHGIGALLGHAQAHRPEEIGEHGVALFDMTVVQVLLGRALLVEKSVRGRTALGGAEIGIAGLGRAAGVSKRRSQPDPEHRRMFRV